MTDLWKNKDYVEWINNLKKRFRQVQLKAAVKINNELLNFYWELGKEITQKQKETKWGDKFLESLSKDLMAEFPNVKGFSKRNLEQIRRWYLFWNKAIENGWSRAVLTHQIESGLYKRTGKAITNFDITLPKPQSDLARETIKDPYCFDFLTLREDYTEKELEDNLLTHLTNFLLELGSGFSFLGREYKLEVGEDEFFIDLLFYHVKLHCYIVVELKTDKFKPEYTGELNFYVSAVIQY